MIPPGVIEGRALVRGSASGTALVLEEPLSFWGGLDPATGRIIDRRHPQCDASISGAVLVMTSGRGSSSSSTVLAEAIRLGTAPCAIVLGCADAIVTVGAMVAQELYGVVVPVVVVGLHELSRIRTGQSIEVAADGAITFADGR
jgi:hypothetical protein